MAGLIVKSPYLKCGGGSSVSGYLRYIGTRERVEIIPDDRPPTRKQEQLITKLTKDFPEAKELGEYSDYKDKPTKANASVVYHPSAGGKLVSGAAIGRLHEVHRHPASVRSGWVTTGSLGTRTVWTLEQTMRRVGSLQRECVDPHSLSEA